MQSLLHLLAVRELMDKRASTSHSKKELKMRERGERKRKNVLLFLELMAKRISNFHYNEVQ